MRGFRTKWKWIRRDRRNTHDCTYWDHRWHEWWWWRGRQTAIGTTGKTTCNGERERRRQCRRVQSVNKLPLSWSLPNANSYNLPVELYSVRFVCCNNERAGVHPLRWPKFDDRNETRWRSTARRVQDDRPTIVDVKPNGQWPTRGRWDVKTKKKAHKFRWRVDAVVCL